MNQDAAVRIRLRRHAAREKVNAAVDGKENGSAAENAIRIVTDVRAIMIPVLSPVLTPDHSQMQDVGAMISSCSGAGV